MNNDTISHFIVRFLGYVSAKVQFLCKKKKCFIHLWSPYTRLGALCVIADVTGSAGPVPAGGRGPHRPRL